MAFVITRLCRDCVDGACVDVCPTDCIVEPRAGVKAELPRQLYINPDDCIHCSLCAPECPWEAIYAAEDVPTAFHDDIALNAKAASTADFQVPVERLKRKPGSEEIEQNRLKWELSAGIQPAPGR
jgi:ferredoxin